MGYKFKMDWMKLLRDLIWKNQTPSSHDVALLAARYRSQEQFDVIGGVSESPQMTLEWINVTYSTQTADVACCIFQNFTGREKKGFGIKTGS